jgi:hypothetical protein
VGGKLDFHACRVAYINFVIESGVSVKKAQVLARHSTPELTLNVYGRTREDRLAKVVDEVADKILPREKRALCVHSQAVGAEGVEVNPLDSKKLSRHKNGGGGGNRTPIHTTSGKNTTETETAHSQAKPANNSELQSPTDSTPKHKTTNQNSKKTKLCTKSVQHVCNRISLLR